MRDFDPTASEFITSGYLGRSQPGGVLYDVGSIVGAVAGPVIGGLLGGDAAEGAANTQAASADRATQLQKQMFDKQVELQAPFRETGLQANNRLALLLGLGNLVDESGPEWAPNADLYSSDPSYRNAWDQFIVDHRAKYGVNPSAARGSDATSVQGGLAARGFGQGGTGYGSLMRRFSMADFEADPGYAFRMNEGLNAVESGAAARGGLLSGAALKAVQKYGQGLASEEYGRAYGRFTADQTNSFNRLKSMVDTGTGASTQISNAAGNFGQQAGANAIGAGNAIAAGQMGQANALVSGVNGGLNNYQQIQQTNRLMDLIRSPGAGTTSTAGLRPTVESYYGY